MKKFDVICIALILAMLPFSQGMAQTTTKSTATTATVINFRQLQEAFPASFKDYTRKKPTGMSNSMMGVSSSVATLELSKEVKAKEGDYMENLTLTVEIMDYLYMMEGVDMSMSHPCYALTMVQLDEETESGYKKTTTYNGFNVVEEKQEYSASVVLCLGKRIIVSIKSNLGVDVAELYALFDQLDVKKLEGFLPK